jgi:hypothetical protein
MNIPPSQLDDPDYARFAWGRYKRLLRGMVWFSALAVILCLGLLRWISGPVPWPMLAFTAGGVFFSVLLAAILMGLVFLSSGSGHDDKIIDPTRDEDRYGGN